MLIGRQSAPMIFHSRLTTEEAERLNDWQHRPEKIIYSWLEQKLPTCYEELKYGKVCSSVKNLVNLFAENEDKSKVPNFLEYLFFIYQADDSNIAHKYSPLSRINLMNSFQSLVKKVLDFADKNLDNEKLVLLYGQA